MRIQVKPQSRKKDLRMQSDKIHIIKITIPYKSLKNIKLIHVYRINTVD